MTEAGYSTQEEEIIMYDESPDYRTIHDLVYDLQTNGFRTLLPYNKYNNSEEFLEETYNILKNYRSKDYGSSNEVDYSISCTIFEMLKILDDLNKPDLSYEEINKLSKLYYIEMKILRKLNRILYGSISAYNETTYFSKLYFLVEPIVI